MTTTVYAVRGLLAQASPRNAPKLERIRLWLRAIVERGWLPPVDRLAAGNALAVLGDDRDFDALIEIPAGLFWMGDDDLTNSEKPCHEVKLPAYKIGQYPVTGGQFRRFVEASGYRHATSRCLDGIGNHPVVYVTWHDVRVYCDWLTREWRAAGKIGVDEMVRLPTEAELEKAARGGLPSPDRRGAGGEVREYPWGNE